MPKVIGIIPSRYASRRFPGKPLVLLAGVPLIVRVVQQAQKSALLNEVIVATDDARIADTVERHGGQAIIAKGEFTCGSERVASVAKDIEADVILNIQGDEPLLSPEIIDGVASLIMDNSKTLMSTACSPITDDNQIDNPDIVKVALAKDRRALYFSRGRIPWSAGSNAAGRPQGTNIFRHIGVYGFDPDFLQTFASLKRTPLEGTEGLEQLRALENGYDIFCLLAKHEFLGIDTEEDLFRAEKMLESLR